MDNEQARKLDAYLTSLQQHGLAAVQPSVADEPDELQAMLVLAESMEVLDPGPPNPAFVQNASVRIWNRIKPKPVHSRIARPVKSTGKVVWRRALAGGFLALALIFSGLGVASASALPGDALYGFKRGLETVQLAFAFTPQHEGNLLIGFVQERLDEVEALTLQDRPEDLALALDEYTESVDELVNFSATHAQDWGEGLEAIGSSLTNHTQVLEVVREQVPESAQAAIDHAIERSQHGQAVLEILRQGGSPSELAPGQQDADEDQNSQQNNSSNNGNAYGRDKNNHTPRGRNNQGRGNSNGNGNTNPSEDNRDKDKDKD